MKKPQPLSREFLLSRGFCCNNGCLNCPYKMKSPKTYEDLIETVLKQVELDVEEEKVKKEEGTLNTSRPLPKK